MRSILQVLVRPGICCLLGLVTVSGCAKKIVAPNSRPLPEGKQAGQMLMLAWPEQASTRFVASAVSVTDPTPQDLLLVENFYWANRAGVRSSTLDFSAANQLQPFRKSADGNVRPMFDYLLPPSLRFIGSNLDLYDFEDFSPPANPAYVARGAMNGLVTTQSPLSNVAIVSGPMRDDLDFIPRPKSLPNDSVLKVQFTEDPRAAFYVLEIGSADVVLARSEERLVRGLPSPLSPGTRPLFAGFAILAPGQGSKGFGIPFTTRRWPLRFYLRVSAFDQYGCMVNRVNDYLRSISNPIAFIFYEPMGGAVEVLDPYPSPIDPERSPDVISSSEARGILASLGGGAVPSTDKMLSTSGAPEPSAASDHTSELIAPDARFSPQALRESLTKVRREMELRSNESHASAGLHRARNAAPSRGH